jgi:hypothetical protein
LELIPYNKAEFISDKIFVQILSSMQLFSV